eukprot:10083801-Alexandrium_andersonii.AAC.1
MSASLVGSEMCIRDSPGAQPTGAKVPLPGWCPSPAPPPPLFARKACLASVSYTHLTLPTICSV